MLRELINYLLDKDVRSFGVIPWFQEGVTLCTRPTALLILWLEKNEYAYHVIEDVVYVNIKGGS